MKEFERNIQPFLMMSSSRDMLRLFQPTNWIRVMERSGKGKLRVVFDCGAVYKGTSLNCQLLPGPKLTNSLIGVLIRFRQEPVAVVADIQAMFHQVRVSEKYLNFLCFLWWPQGDTTHLQVEYRMSVHLFGAVSSPSCANYALRETDRRWQPVSFFCSGSQCH